jgi:hypothetical protein
MLRSYETGYTVMNEALTSYSFESTDIKTCKSYCRKGDVIVRRIPYVNGYSFRITWSKYYWKPIYLKLRSRECNIFYLHLNWNREYSHKIGEVVYRG